MKILITPLGFDKDQILSFLIAEGFSKQDRVVILRPVERGDEDRGEKAFIGVRELINSVAPSVDIQKIVIDTRDFENVVKQIAKIFEESGENDVIVNLSGGVRRIVVGLSMCCTIFGDRINKVYSYCPIEHVIQEISIPHFKYELKENEFNILKLAVDRESVSYNELAEYTNLSKSSISRICKDLESKGMLSLFQHGREVKMTTTLTGEMVISSIKDLDLNKR